MILMKKLGDISRLFIFDFRLPATLKTFQKTEQMLHICLRFMKYQFLEVVSHQSTPVGLPCGLGMNILYHGSRNQKWISSKVNINLSFTRSFCSNSILIFNYFAVNK